MPYRTELRRPDLKGNFRCSLCNKIFCHSSSLSRHRMQAHFKSYTCTLCNKEITSNETLRAHMFKLHQISRMFMCRCCNWAFPDKTSLHIHVQSMASAGSPGNVSIIAKSSADGKGSPPPTFVNSGSGGSSIFPSMPSREELINRLRERAMLAQGFNSMFTINPETGEAIKAEGMDSAETGSEDGNNNMLALHMKDAANSWSEEDTEGMIIDEYDEESYINTEYTAEDGEELGEEMVAAVNVVKQEVDADALAAASPPPSSRTVLSPKKQSPMVANALANSSGSSIDHMIRDRPTAAEEAAALQSAQMLMANQMMAAAAGGFLPMAMSLPHAALGAAANLPILRSAISASPLNSLMYQKKLNTVLRKGPLDSAAQGFLHGISRSSPVTTTTYTTVAGSNKGTGKQLVGTAPATLTPPPSVEVSSEGVPTSGSSNNGISPAPSHDSGSSTQASSPQDSKTECFQCRVMQGRLALAENRNQFQSEKVGSLESKVSRLESRIKTLEGNTRRYESEGKLLNEHCELLERKLLNCQERTLRLLQDGELTNSEQLRKFLQGILETCSLK